MAEPTKRQCEVPPTLVKYEPAVQIYESIRSYHKKIEGKQQLNQLIPPKKQQIINSILPPRDWVDNLDKLYIQYVSHQPASRDDVISLQQKLDRMLDDRQARKFGVCPIREELYSQVFDEIIRQVAVDCPERGLLLMRVRDQHRMTLTAYQTIYQSSVVFGLKKQVESEERAGNLDEEIKLLEKNKEELEDKRDVLVCKKELLQRQIRERTNADSTKRQEQLRFLKMQTQNLTKFLEIVKVQLR